MTPLATQSGLVKGFAATGVALLLAVVHAMPGQAATESPATDTSEALHDQIVDLAHTAIADSDLATTEWADTHVEVLRDEPGWAFGTVVLVAPQVEDARPRDWLFVAELHQGRWQVALDGQADFAELASRAPVVTAQEKRLFAEPDEAAEAKTGNALEADGETQANGDWRTGMRLPWAVGQTWQMTGGPHAYDAGNGPWSSVDLAGGDQVVRAVRGGVAYTPCVGLTRIVHDRGYSTRYYHLISHPWFNGTSVGEGAFLGYTGREIGCGGAASARHVHFSLEQHSQFVNIAYHIIGKWVFMNGGSQYQGSALHGSQISYVGGNLYNYGVLGFTQGIVDADGGGSLNKRSGPGTGYSVVGSVADGATVSISCSAYGTSHSGRWGATSLWNRLTDGTWVSDAYLYTGSNNPLNGWC